ncbi:MAG: c-type cytochrome domain-containing protein [Limisphaerales bacterium]
MFLRFMWGKMSGVILLASLVPTWGGSAGNSISYNRDIRPIFSENCFSCHGTDSASRKAGLRLDRFDSVTNVLDDNAVAIVPGKPDDSELVRRIFATDGDQMPPKKVEKVLTPAQKECLKNGSLRARCMNRIGRLFRR